MACECIAEFDDKLAPHGLQLSVGQMFDHETGKRTGERMLIAMEKVSTQRPVKYGKVTLVATYCPFCGARYTPEEPLTDERGEEGER